ncbi:flagellar basal body-associated FliL family protein [Pilimelia columellifera]|uniref:Flagellar protein FliL n=1 Tax=Pilimelia columellifera subsp. columellifera TaxID=706583 RepID=A0ABN3N7S6_9ACTN
MSDSKPAEPEKKSSKKMLIMIVLAVLLLGGGGGAYFFLFAGSAEAEVAPEPGPVVVMDPVTINLADGHFLKVSIALQTKLDAETEPDGSKALDLTIAHFGELKMANLSTGAGRAKAKKDLVQTVKKAYEGDVYDIYFREFVMQ